MISLNPYVLMAKGIAKKIPRQVWYLIGGVLLFCIQALLFYNKGQANVQAKWDKAVNVSITILKPIPKAQQEINTRVETIYKDRIKVIHVQGKTIIKEVPIYFHDLPDLSGRFRVLHDSSATGQTASSSDWLNAPSVSAEDFATTVSENYTGCRLNAEQVTSLLDWAKQQEALVESICKQPGVACSGGSQ